MINNTPEIKLGIVAVSRDCFPNSLSENGGRARHADSVCAVCQI